VSIKRDAARIIGASIARAWTAFWMRAGRMSALGQ
jgi:hypothetical protein